MWLFHFFEFDYTKIIFFHQTFKGVTISWETENLEGLWDLYCKMCCFSSGRTRRVRYTWKERRTRTQGDSLALSTCWWTSIQENGLSNYVQLTWKPSLEAQRPLATKMCPGALDLQSIFRFLPPCPPWKRFCVRSPAWSQSLFDVFPFRVALSSFK